MFQDESKTPDLSTKLFTSLKRIKENLIIDVSAALPVIWVPHFHLGVDIPDTLVKYKFKPMIYSMYIYYIEMK